MKRLNRWIYAVIGVIVLLLAGLIYAWSVLVIPIANEFTNWSHTSLSLTFTICMTLFCIGGLIGGILQKNRCKDKCLGFRNIIFCRIFYCFKSTKYNNFIYRIWCISRFCIRACL